MNLAYTVETLQQFDERAREKAEKLGLPLPDVHFHLVQAEEMYDIAARGLPGRYSHYQFGRAYEHQKGDYDRGRGRIYELVINTEPVHAYLLDGNGLVAQLLVIAHVYGHAAMFENSRYFAPADKAILARVRGGAERIDGYIGEYGRTRVEDFIDSCEALAYQRSFAILGKQYQSQGPQWETKPFDDLFPEETHQRKAEYLAEREAYRMRFPKQPEGDILAFVEKHARRLADWQRDVISIIRTEMEYFVPQMRTQVVNEATAVYYHNTLLQEFMAEDVDTFSTDDFVEFQRMNAGVLHPKIAFLNAEGQPPKQADEEIFVHCTGINPYLTGTTIYNEIRRICEAPTDEERERWPHWAGQISWDEKRAEIVECYDDAALLTEFISPKVCEAAKLFMKPRTRAEYEDLRVLEDECEEVRKVVVRSKTEIAPVIEIIDADYCNRGELLLIHRHHDIGLDNEYTKGTLPHLAELWGHPVVVKTLVPGAEDNSDPDGPHPVCWYRCAPGEQATRDTTEPA